MSADFYPIDLDGYSLAIMPRPRAGDWLEDEISHWQRRGVQVVISMLEPAEVAELGLQDEALLCAKQGIDFLSFPIPDRGVPPKPALLDDFLTPLVARLKAGDSIAVHCRAGIGRSALVAACLLSRAGVAFERIFPAISRARGLAVPDTQEQEQWTQTFARRR